MTCTFSLLFAPLLCKTTGKRRNTFQRAINKALEKKRETNQLSGTSAVGPFKRGDSTAPLSAIQITPADKHSFGYAILVSRRPHNRTNPSDAPYGCCHHLKMAAAALDGYHYGDWPLLKRCDYRGDRWLPSIFNHCTNHSRRRVWAQR